MKQKTKKSENSNHTIKIKEVLGENDNLRKTNSDPKEAVKLKELKLQMHEIEIKGLEQYALRNIVRKYGVDDSDKKESSGKKLQNSKLNIQLRKNYTDVLQGLGSFREDGKRLIICKLKILYPSVWHLLVY